MRPSSVRLKLKQTQLVIGVGLFRSVGVPRSGTTLVEQILATQSQVYAAGECDFVPRLVADLSGKPGGAGAYPEGVTDFTSEQVGEYSRLYLGDVAGSMASGARLVTDKMPENFLHLGIIALLFPGARIIHCTRDPLDTCLSCYFNEFAGAHNYAYNLSSLGTYYVLYRKIMRHWKSALSLPIHEICYEGMVAGTEEQCRRIFEFLELDWDERCLQFYRSDRFVNTASQHQVNQPVYTSSVGQWKHCRAYLAELVSAIEAAQ